VGDCGRLTSPELRKAFIRAKEWGGNWCRPEQHCGGSANWHTIPTEKGFKVLYQEVGNRQYGAPTRVLEISRTFFSNDAARRSLRRDVRDKDCFNASPSGQLPLQRCGDGMESPRTVVSQLRCLLTFAIHVVLSAWPPPLAPLRASKTRAQRGSETARWRLAAQRDPSLHAPVGDRPPPAAGLSPRLELDLALLDRAHSAAAIQSRISRGHDQTGARTALGGRDFHEPKTWASKAGSLKLLRLVRSSWAARNQCRAFRGPTLVAR